MKWERSSPELAALFEELTPSDPRVSPRKMFGYPCFFVSGNLAAGLHQQKIIFRLPDDDREKFLKSKDATEFEPMPGRKMKGYLALAQPLRHGLEELQRWTNRALEFTASLPAKEARKPAATAKRPGKKK